MPHAPAHRVVTPRFVLIVAAGTAYFFALAMLTPVLPLYVKGPLSGGGVQVGIGVGAFAVGAVLLRPYAGRVGDRFGRRPLVIGGAAVVSVSILGYGLVRSLLWLVLARTVTGFGEAAFFVGAATMITDLAPEERRGEAVSYWSIAVYGGLAFGPALGEVVLGGHRYTATWIVAAGLALLAAMVGLAVEETDPARAPRAAGAAPPRAASEQPLLHPAAIRPGIVLFLGLVGLAGFTAFVPLYVKKLGHGDAGVVFLVYGVCILAVRVIGARLPDRLGAARAGSLALAGGTAGLVIMTVIPSIVGLFVATAVFAFGMSLLYPALLVMALEGVPPNERGSVVGTFSSFFDLSQGLGALVCGIAVSLTGYRGAFAVGAVLAFAGLLVLRFRKPASDAPRALPDPAAA